MRITKAEWNRYKNTMSQLSDKASKEFSDWANQNGGWETVDRQLMAEVAWSIASKYSEGSSALAAQMYDAIAQAEGVNVPPAEMAADVDFGELAKAINGALKHSTDDDFVSSPVGRSVKQAGADTMLKNASRDRAEFAWISSGDSCAFCLVLASKGWTRASKKTTNGDHASHIHTHCDCQFAIRFNKNTQVEGYDPSVYEKMYYDAEGKTSAEKIKSLQSKYYQENKDEINARKRELREINKMEMKYNSNTSWKGKPHNNSKNDIKELTQFAIDKGFKLDNSFNSFDGDVELVKDFLTYMDRNLNNSELLNKEKIRLSVKYSLDDDTYAETSGSNIFLNGFAYRDRELLKQDYQKKVDEKWFTENSTYYDISTHESAHLIVILNQLKYSGVKTYVFGDNIEKSTNEIINRVSEYALKNDQELIAESYVSYKNGSSDEYILKVLKYCGIL